MQLSVMAVAALAVFAVAAVMLLSGGNPAQATTAENLNLAPDNGDGIHMRPMQDDKKATPTPRTHATPEPCPGEPRNLKTLDHVVDSGHIALFDVYWNPVERELTNTSCPPTVTHVPAQGRTPASDTRSPSSINIAETVIHIPNSAKIDLSETDTPYTQAKYPELWAADDLENRDTNGDGTFDGVGDRLVWALPACPPAGSSETVGLCLSFSTALLNDSGADWVDLTVDDEGNVSGGIEYHIDHVHQIDIDKQDPRYTLAYDAYDADATDANAALWNSANARVAVMPVAVGEYERPMWFFTDRGTYELQVHIRGNPQRDPEQLGGLLPLGTEESVTSDVREYTLHVGTEADLSVGVTVEEAATGTAPLEPGDNVTVTVTASNAGPEKAPDTKVAVSLPSGLVPPVDGQPYPSQATKGTYADGVWTIGSMCNPTVPAKPSSDPPEPECPQEATLTITATVAGETYGQELAVKATISATETLVITESEDNQKVAKNYTVPVLDTDPDDDMATGTVTVATFTNMDPMFMIRRSVNENAIAGTTVGDPIEATDPNFRDQLLLTYSLMDYRSGNSADKFTVSRNAEGDAQIATAAVLNYEDDKHHYVKLCVSDGKSHQGADPSIDHCILVYIQVVNDPNETLSVKLTAGATSQTVNQNVDLTGTISNSPVETNAIICQWSEENVPTTGDDQSERAFPPFEKQVTYGRAAQREYTLGCQYRDDGQTVFREASVTVNWTSAK